MLAALVPSLLAALAGGSIVLQQVLNGTLRMGLRSATWAGFTSYFVGVLCMALLALLLREPPPPLAVLARIPWWAWTGGMFGAVFIGLAILLIPKLGAAAFIVLLVAGQMIASLAFDQFGWLGLPQRPIDASRLIGVVLLVGGVVLIRR